MGRGSYRLAAGLCSGRDCGRGLCAWCSGGSFAACHNWNPAARARSSGGQAGGYLQVRVLLDAGAGFLCVLHHALDALRLVSEFHLRALSSVDDREQPRRHRLPPNQLHGGSSRGWRARRLARSTDSLRPVSHRGRRSRWLRPFWFSEPGGRIAGDRQTIGDGLRLLRGRVRRQYLRRGVRRHLAAELRSGNRTPEPALEDSQAGPPYLPPGYGRPLWEWCR